MRPAILNNIFKLITSLDGIGPKNSKLVARALKGSTAAENKTPRLVDLLWHGPHSLVDRTFQPRIAEVQDGVIATIAVIAGAHKPPPASNKRVPYRVPCFDESGEITLTFFHAHKDYLEKALPEGERRHVSGKIEFYNDRPQMTHPDYILTDDELAALPLIEPIYPLSGGLSGKSLLRAVREAVAAAPELPEWQDPAWRAQQKWPGWNKALKSFHNPESLRDFEADTPARQRLAYDELLANQLALALMRAHVKKTRGRAIKGDQAVPDNARAALAYQLTGTQEQAVAEIFTDMAAPTRMLRLLQGDVGSGKTVVALLAALNAIAAGLQAALMAPTEILARQHFETLAPLCEKIGISICILTGRDKGKARSEILQKIKDGTAQLVIGTHTLFQRDVDFHDLGLAVIDEQHRFGVNQRLMLSAKGKSGGVDVLVMTATPIPRTLTLTIYGDMDVSRLTEKPPGRQKIDTRTLPLNRLGDVIEGLKRAIVTGARVYWVCPLVEESDVLSDIAAAEERHSTLKQYFGDRAGLVHGRMGGPEKDAIMADFQAGRLDILVATTVIEVGIDVPEASIMVIEHAERFGLTQLHQLRGRVGRGPEKSNCILLYQSPLGANAKARLEIMRKSDDGFYIAEEDLRLRGAGEVLGTKQSGLPEFKLADVAAHGELMAAAHDDAALILRQDPGLESERGKNLRILLYLFELDEAVKYLKSG